MKKKLKEVPTEPGVYLFKDSSGKVIYVGKAKSLRERLSTHLNCTDPKDKSYRIVKASCDFDYIVVKNEREALALEAELIKKHLPKFNVLLKDGKSYPYLVITKEEFPTVKVVRKGKEEVKGEYFGPFIPPKNAHYLKELLHKVFKLRKCKELKKREKPCLEYYIERCTAPCAGKVSKEDYQRQVKGALSFLKGKVKELISSLYDEIEKASSELNFERAALLRDQLIALKTVYERSPLLSGELKEADLFYLEEKGGLFKGVKLTVRNGFIYGKEEFTFDPVEPWEEKLLRELFSLREKKLNLDVVGTIWIRNTYELLKPPEKVLANFNFLGRELKVEPIKEELLPLLKKNRGNYSYALNLEKLEREYEEVFYEPLPQRIECFDISTLQGQATVASCVVWEKGELLKGDYRRYKVKTVKGVNDYASMEEVLKRRFKRIKEGKVKRPDLVVVDGGVGQLNVALKVKEELGLDFRVFALAKKEETFFTDDGEVIKLKEFPYLFRLFTTLRDEAHRFALSYNRKLRLKEMVKSPLDGIKGLGKKRREILERLYPDLKEIANLQVEELKKVGIPEKVAEEVISKVRELFS